MRTYRKIDNRYLVGDAVMALLTLPGILRGKLGRWQGITLLGIYLCFMLTQFVFVRAV